MRIHHPGSRVEHDLDTVVLVEQGVVVLALLALHPALAGVVIEGSSVGALAARPLLQRRFVSTKKRAPWLVYFNTR